MQQPFVCAAARPAHSFRAISVALSAGRRPMRRNRLPRSSPSTYSIEMNVDLADVVDAAQVGMRDLPRERRPGEWGEPTFCWS